MKVLILALVLGFLVSFAPANSQQIETDYLEAISASRKEQKGMLYLFLNSDNRSQSSKDFNKNFLRSDNLSSLGSKFVVLKVDCSSDVGSDSKEAVYCKRLSSIYNRDKVFPAILATDKNNQKVGELQTDFSKSAINDYLNFLKSL